RLIGNHDGPSISVISLGLPYEYKLLPDADAARSRLKSIRSFNSNRPFVLHVGSNLRRKNRDGVLRIFARIHNDWDGQLVFAGEPLDTSLRRMAVDLGIVDRVIEVPNPPDELLEVLYNCAVALLYPSRFEGFGWPVIEAQACGCPVVCSNSGPIPEAAGNA